MIDSLLRIPLVFCLTLLPLAVQAQDGHAHQPAKAAKKPALAIGAAFAPDGALWAVGLDAQARLELRISRDDGRSWQAPRLLDNGGEAVAADGESRPKLAFGPQGQVVVAYTTPLSKPYTGAIRLLRSTDGGATFAAPATVHHDRQLITHRFESIAFDAQGRLHTAWVDKRDLELAKKGSGKPAYRGAAIYHNVSLDGGASFGPDTKLADYSCECCRIALAPTPDGQVAALWRHVFAPNIRDHAFALLGAAAPAAAPVRATFDNWAVDACPHHGPALAPAADGGYHAVWFGERAGLAQVRYGRLDRDGKPVGAVLALPDEQAEHADVLSAGKRVAIVWRSFDGSSMNLKAWVSDDDGQHFILRQLARSTAESDSPHLLRKGTQLFVIWNTAGERHVAAL
ncbi:sialidase family protein [Herminiimonas sp. CN]|uniref:sialidase family protein n=1 Tax=Herminiimonas sp. CN TaxID=1349818 RepID=UPI0004740864|nr:sialidase family protein [Herminiimonas sp. CN]